MATTSKTKPCLSGEKLTRMIGQARVKCVALQSSDKEKHDNLDTTLAIDFAEHFAFQELKSLAFVMERLDIDAGNMVYAALGHHYTDSNGGWSQGTDLATKVVVTQLMGELLTMKINGKL